MPAWFDVLSRSPSSAVQDPNSVADAASSLKQLLLAEAANLQAAGASNISRLVLGGFSQGGALALHTGLTNPGCQLAGIVGLSCYLPLIEQGHGHNEYGGQAQPPVFLAHGDADEVVLPARSQAAGQLMQQRLGVTDLRYRIYPGLGHCDGKQEMDDLKEFIWSVLPEQ